MVGLGCGVDFLLVILAVARLYLTAAGFSSFFAVVKEAGDLLVSFFITTSFFLSSTTFLEAYTSFVGF